MANVIILRFFLFGNLLVSAMQSQASPVLGFNITDLGGKYGYTPAATSDQSLAHLAIDEIKTMGSTHVVLNVRAHMHGPRSADIRLLVDPTEIQVELRALKNLINYCHRNGMTVGFRPLLLVLGPNGEFPYKEGAHLWWHGNINPKDQNKWFDAFENFLLHYARGLQGSGLDEFTIGAEMQSMMVGMGQGEQAYLLGKPERWLKVLRAVRALHPNAKITYDINFPETLVPLTNTIGGEFERWRHIIVDLENTTSSDLQERRQSLISLWREMDFIGIDFYRYLATSSKNLPVELNALTDRITPIAMSHASQIDNSISEIAMVTGIEKPIAIKEIGYKSTPYSFINPAAYSSDNEKLNITHQAAAYKAISNAFLKARWPWLYGIYFWDISTSPSLKGPNDTGFSPLGKAETLQVIKEDYVDFINLNWN